MVVVCDPVNPFGTVQTRDELAALCALSAERGVVIVADSTHSAHRVDPAARHHPIAAVAAEHPGATVLVASGLAHGYGMAGARIGALGGPPALVRACLQVKIAAVRLNTNRLAQVGAAAALRDGVWLRRGEEVIRRNLARLREIARPVIDPAYGFSCVVDVSETGASAQELTVALCRRRVAVYPGDGLGEVGRHHHDPPQPERPRPLGARALRLRLPRGVRGGGERDLPRRGRGAVPLLRHRPGPADRADHRPRRG